MRACPPLIPAVPRPARTDTAVPILWWILRKQEMPTSDTDEWLPKLDPISAPSLRNDKHGQEGWVSGKKKPQESPLKEFRDIRSMTHGLKCRHFRKKLRMAFGAKSRKKVASSVSGTWSALKSSLLTGRWKNANRSMFTEWIHCKESKSLEPSWNCIKVRAWHLPGTAFKKTLFKCYKFKSTAKRACPQDRPQRQFCDGSVAATQLTLPSLKHFNQLYECWQREGPIIKSF